MDIEHHCFEALKDMGCDEKSLSNTSIAVAVSGGSDSLALALILNAYCKDHSIHLVALIVDHGLREQSSEEAQIVQSRLQSHEVSSYILKIPPGTIGATDIQNKARRRRYDLIHDWCLNQGIKHVFLGHHAQDQYETKLMRVRQGTGLSGLSGMRMSQAFQGIYLHRPFLNPRLQKVKKQDFQTYLLKNNMQWIEDPSNKNQNFERVFWREYDRQDVVDTTIGNDLNEWVWRFLRQHGDLNPLGYVSLERAAYLLLPKAFQGILLRTIIYNIGTQNYPPAVDQINLALSSFEHPRTLGGIRISQKEGRLYFVREYKTCKPLAVKQGAKAIFWDYRFVVRIPEAVWGGKSEVSALGEELWQELVSQNATLKSLDHPRYALWSLPVLHVQDRVILPQYLQKYVSCSNQEGSISTFQAEFLGKSLHQSFSFSE